MIDGSDTMGPYPDYLPGDLPEDDDDPEIVEVEVLYTWHERRLDCRVGRDANEVVHWVDVFDADTGVRVDVPAEVHEAIAIKAVDG